MSDHVCAPFIERIKQLKQENECLRKNVQRAEAREEEAGTMKTAYERLQLRCLKLEREYERLWLHCLKLERENERMEKALNDITSDCIAVIDDGEPLKARVLLRIIDKAKQGLEGGNGE